MNFRAGQVLLLRACLLPANTSASLAPCVCRAWRRHDGPQRLWTTWSITAPRSVRCCETWRLWTQPARATPPPLLPPAAALAGSWVQDGAGCRCGEECVVSRGKVLAQSRDLQTAGVEAPMHRALPCAAATSDAAALAVVAAVGGGSCPRAGGGHGDCERLHHAGAARPIAAKCCQQLEMCVIALMEAATPRSLPPSLRNRLCLQKKCDGLTCSRLRRQTHEDVLKNVAAAKPGMTLELAHQQ